jgi:pimeloyl-ACP methyl ester carboxylesterase
MIERALVSSGNSTNVRLMQAWLAAARPAFSLLSATSPELAERWAERLFFTAPRAQEPSQRARAALDSGERFELMDRGRRLAAWRWGSGPAVLLLHGWGGRSSQMTSFVPGLVASGFSAVAVDAPAHGASEGTRTNLLEFADVLGCLAAASGPIAGAVGHSLGGVAVALAAGRGQIDAPRLALVATAANPERFYFEHLARLGVPPARRGKMLRLFERSVGATWPEFFVPSLIRKVDRPVLVVHDRDDREVPADDAQAIAEATPKAELLLTGGLGHRRILRHAPAIERVTGFFAAPERKSA